MVVALIVIAVVALIVLGAWWNYTLKKRRREGLAAVGLQLGLDYSAADPFGLVGLPFRLFTMGDGRGVENVLSGTWQGLPLREFDYWYYDESTDSEGHTSRTYHRFSCAVTEIALDSPGLSISEENLFSRLADHMGFRDIDFELEEFNRAFQVKSKDRKFANDVVDARMMKWLLAEGRKFDFDLVGPWLLCSSGRRKPEELIPLLGALKGFRDHIPRVAWSLHGEGGAQPPEPS